MSGVPPHLQTLEGDLSPGDRVRLREGLSRYHGCEYGVISALFAGTEDTIELLLDSGIYTCVDPPDVEKVS